MLTSSSPSSRYWPSMAETAALLPLLNSCVSNTNRLHLHVPLIPHSLLFLLPQTIKPGSPQAARKPPPNSAVCRRRRPQLQANSGDPVPPRRDKGTKRRP